MKPHPILRALLASLFAAAAAAPMISAAPIAWAATAGAPSVELEARSRALQRAAASVVGLRSLAVDGARSSSTLGRARQGSGIVIDQDGLVLTIGYLILEAEQVLLTTDDERTLPARVVGYDIASGLGLVQALSPLRVEPAPLGVSGKVGQTEPLMIASGGESGAVSVAQLVSRRPFAGYWEYHIDDAMFTAPPRGDHSGAGLFNGGGELIGVGSLFVSDAAGPDQGRRPGNMFVPVDLLQPIVSEMRSTGTSARSHRAWLGINCVESDGDIRIVRVTDDSPADEAGLLPGDRILKIDGAEVHALAMLWKSLWAGGSPEREVLITIQRDGKTQTLTVRSVDRIKTLKRSQGI